MKLDESDALLGASISNGADEIVLVTSDGNAIRFAEESVRPMGPVAGGVAGIKLAEGARVVGYGMASAGSDLIVVSAAGSGKRTALKEYPRQGRYGVGVRTAVLNDRTGELVGAWVAGDEDQATILSAKGAALVTQASLIGKGGRAKRGSTLMELKQGDSVWRLIALARRVEAAPGAPAPGPQTTSKPPPKQVAPKNSERDLPRGGESKPAKPAFRSASPGKRSAPGKKRNRRQ
jgi:DNA gyrase subunit A